MLRQLAQREEQQMRERIEEKVRQPVKHIDEAALMQKDLDDAAERERVVTTAIKECAAIVKNAPNPYETDASAAQEQLLQSMTHSVFDAALNSLPSTGLHAESTKGRGALTISNEEIVALAKLPRAVRVERFKKWHKDDKCQRDGCTKFVGNHSLKKFVAHYHVAVFNEPLELQAEVLTFEFAERYSTAEIDAVRGVFFDDCRIATKFTGGEIVSFRLSRGFRIAIYERANDYEFVMMCEKVNEDAEAADSRIF